MAVAAVAIGGCSGGGGGSSSGLADNPSTTFLSQAEEPSAPFAVSDWSSSQEYANSTGLAQLRAAEGYARRAGGLPGGEGVRVAVIDSGIDVTHQDLGNLASQSWAAGGEPLVGESHATFVAGIIGARRTGTSNPNDMHGIAYRATLLNFQAARPSVTQSTGSVSFSSSDLISAIDIAAGLDGGSLGFGADVINLSLGAFSTSDSTFAGLRSAMIDAAGQDRIMVLAAGNEGLDSDPTRKLQPIYPAAYADDPGIAGLAIVVGNLTSTDEAAASSNLCGDTKDYCLFAPGTNIRSSIPGGGYGIGSGTSFAAPYVSGAAAVVKAAFPGVSSRDVVDRLLLTAADLGDAGVDATFGRGRLDLEAAMAPVGPVGLPISPTVDGPAIAVASSDLRLGPGLAIDAAGRGMLAHAVGLDEMGFPFPTDLNRRIKVGRRASGLAGFVGQERGSSAAALVAGGRLNLSVADGPTRALWSPFEEQAPWSTGPAPDQDPQLTFTTDSMGGIALFGALNRSSGTALGLAAALADRGVELFQPGTFLAPFEHLAGRQSGGGVVVAPDPSLELAISAFASPDDDRGRRTAIQKIEATKIMAGEVELRLGLGMLKETGGPFGTRASGVFGEGIDATSRFVNLSMLAPVTERIDVFAAYSQSLASIKAGGSSLFGDWSAARAEAFGLGLKVANVADDGDGLSLMVGQPFRGRKASTTLALPVGRTPEGAVTFERRRIDLAPRAREIATEAVYSLPLGDRADQAIRAGAFLRINPDHDPGRAPDLGVGLAYHRRF